MSRVDPALEKEFIEVLDSRQDLQLSNVVINYGLHKLNLNLSAKSIFYVSSIMATLLFGITTLISLATARSHPHWTSSVLASFLTAFSFGIVKYLDYHLISSRSDGFPKNLADQALDDDALKALIEWHRSFLSIRKQVLFSSLLSVLGLASAIYAARTMSFDFKLGSYLLVIVCSFAVGHGVYCTFMIPTLVRVISKQRMKLFWLNPAETNWIKNASMFFTKLSIADALIVAIAMSGLYLLKPWESSGTIWMALTWLMIGIVCLAYIFLIPHYYLYKSIRKERRFHLQEMQDLILKSNGPLNKLEGAEFETLLRRIKLYNNLLSAKESAIDLANASKALTSLTIMVLSYLGPYFLKLLGLKTR